MLALAIVSCAEHAKEPSSRQIKAGIELIVLGTVQDAGSPHIACKKSCCSALFNKYDPSRKVSSLGIIDYDLHEVYLFDASPDLTEQVKILTISDPEIKQETPNGIFLTHAHIGHYTGLMYLGKEAMHANAVPVYAMPRMTYFLENNGPWSQLVKLNNIQIQSIDSLEQIQLSENLHVIPIQVPHRDEFSETVGYYIHAAKKTVLFIPDIDKWQKWNRNIVNEIQKVDYAFLDATFFDSKELNNRDMSEVPHPFVVESMELFKDLSILDKAKVYFIHFNHTNPLLDTNSKAYERVLRAGFHVAKFNQRIKL